MLPPQSARRLFQGNVLQGKARCASGPLPDLPSRGMHIHHLPADERPRERCLRVGVGALSAVELLALVLGSGNRDGSALALGHGVLENFVTLRELARAEPAELRRQPGIGEARAVALAAAFELGRRGRSEGKLSLQTVDGPEDAAAIFTALLDGLKQEAVAVLHLGGRHQVLRAATVALGSLNAASVHPREVFRGAVSAGAAAIVLAHNHPSGDPEPSEDDIRLTERLRRCGETLGIEVLDHLVLGQGCWVSLRERRIL